MVPLYLSEMKDLKETNHDVCSRMEKNGKCVVNKNEVPFWPLALTMGLSMRAGPLFTKRINPVLHDKGPLETGSL